MLGDKKGLERKLREHGGVEAWATVLEAKTRWTSGTRYGTGQYTVGNHDHMTVRLKVESEIGSEFEAEFHQAFAHLAPFPGARVKVIYDPNDHDKICIEDEQVFPPGVDPEKATRARARVAEAQEAMESGHFDEYLEKRKAEAMAAGAQVRDQMIQSMGRIDGPAVAGGDTEGIDVADELTKLAALRDRGVLTDAEFEAQKARLLGS